VIADEGYLLNLRGFIHNRFRDLFTTAQRGGTLAATSRPAPVAQCR
jgi:hypothetical protein